MGRKASITAEDVISARAALVAQNRPHGIIAIRKALGRGSPQLIAKFLRESSGTTSEAPARLPDGIARAVESVWEQIWSETGALLNESEAAAEQLETRHAAQADKATGEINSLREALTAKDSDIDSLRAELRVSERANASYSAELESAKSQILQLEQRLMQQQDLFETWRQEQMDERELLKAHLESLAPTANRKRPPRRKVKKGEQLDLYGSEDPNDGG